VALPFTLKLRQKKNYENSNISPGKSIVSKKNPLKETRILQEYQVSTQAKISSFENPHLRIDLLLSPRGQNPLSHYIL
jgi:hypothetical protein